MTVDFDRTIVLVGIACGLLATFYSAENKCKLSLYRVWKANSRIKLLGHFIVFGTCYYLLTVLIMPLVWYIPKISQLSAGVKATVVPLVVAFAPTQVLPFVFKRITKNLVNPEGTGGFLKLVHSIYEWVLAFWTARIRDTEAFYKKELASRSEETQNNIRMLYEFSKLRIAIDEKEHYLLRTDDLIKKCGVLLRFYKFDKTRLMLASDSEYVEKMTREFEQSWCAWDGSERRQHSSAGHGSQLRVSDHVHVRSAIKESFDE